MPVARREQRAVAGGRPASGNEGQCLGGREVVLQGIGVADVGQPLSPGAASARLRHAADQDLAGAGLRQPGQQAKQRGLAAAIAAAQPDDVARLQRQIEAPKQGLLGTRALQTTGLDQCADRFKHGWG